MADISPKPITASELLRAVEEIEALGATLAGKAKRLRTLLDARPTRPRR